MSLGSEEVLVFLDLVYIWLFLCIFGLWVVLVDAVMNHAHWQQVSRVFMSPCSDFSYRIMSSEGQKITNIQYWFSALSLCKFISVDSSASFGHKMYYTVYDKKPQILYSFTLRLSLNCWTTVFAHTVFHRGVNLTLITSITVRCCRCFFSITQLFQRFITTIIISQIS